MSGRVFVLRKRLTWVLATTMFVSWLPASAGAPRDASGKVPIVSVPVTRALPQSLWPKIPHAIGVSPRDNNPSSIRQLIVRPLIGVPGVLELTRFRG